MRVSVDEFSAHEFWLSGIVSRASRALLKPLRLGLDIMGFDAMLLLKLSSFVDSTIHMSATRLIVGKFDRIRRNTHEYLHMYTLTYNIHIYIYVI